MKRLAISLAVVCGLGTALYYLLAPRAATYVCRAAQEAVKESGSVLSIGSCRMSLLTFSATDISYRGLIGRVPMVLEAESSHLTPTVSSLLGDTPAFTLAGALYGGSYDARISLSKSSRTIRGQASLNSLDFSRHPLVATTGVASGQLDLALKEFEVTKNGSFRSDFALNFSNVVKPFPTEIPIRSFGTVRIPAFRDLFLESVGSVTTDRITLRLCNLKSSLGSLAMVGNVPLKGRHGASEEISLRGRIVLTPEGEAAFGQILALLSGRAGASGAPQYDFTVSGTPKSPDWRVTPRTQKP